jgi:hypothetical protein
MPALIARRSRRTPRGCHRAALIVACALLMLATLPASTRAGEYLMRSCNVPGEERAPSAPWRALPYAMNVYANDECASGGGFGLNAGPLHPGGAGLVLERPPEGPQNVIAIHRVRLWMIARLSSTGGPMFVSSASGGPSGEVNEGIFGPPGGSTLTTPWVSSPLLPDTAIFHVLLACAGGDCDPASPNPLEIRGAEVTLSEGVVPSGTIAGGALLSGGPQFGLQGVAYEASDLESGVAQVSVLLGGDVAATQEFGADCQHVDFAACPTRRSGSIMVDTRKVADGNYSLALRVTDAAGNRETIPGASGVIIGNGASGLTPNGDGASSDAKLTAAFAGRRGSNATIPFSATVKIRGRLTTSLGRPIGNARVDVTETPVLTGARITRGAVTTGSNGAFVYTLRRRGMSRTVILRYRPLLGDTRVADTRRLRANVAATGLLRVALHGVRVAYSGRVISRPTPARGKLIYLEGRAVGGTWTRFAVRRTSGAGTFSGHYRLRVHRPGVRLQFRVRIPAEAGYPYAGGVGRPVTRVVR